MADFKAEIRRRLEGVNLSPAREHEIVEELSQHFEDRFEQKLRGSSTEAQRRLGRGQGTAGL